ncbi:DUF859 family phage minor structural protein [Pseudoflavonifractor sp. An187]|uniref:DUF859 family phage minor structural protein n=1 Tax=Pseudoflavonifractor sp. An187 TaxID=1965578 RepID=UPI000B38C084|nr:DUF859 family phage minor structural protein [Pseudoflavonifractor sp. An187]OUP43365.1 hypothetical protein B5F22_08065 [Pseudoflavonifractor sp. An187]
MALQTKTYTQSSNTFTLELTLVEQSTSTAGNTSTLSYTLKLKSTTKNFAQYGVGAAVKLDNQTVAVRDRGSAPKITLGTYSEVTLLSGTRTVAHQSDGSKVMALAYSLDMASASYTPGPMSGSGTMTLTQIPRGATITSAPNFTDEDDPVVKVSNPAGVSVQLGIFKDSTHALADYRTISGTSYTFRLTLAEREAMRRVDTTKNTAQVRFYVKSTVGGQTFITYLTRTLTIQTPAPTLNPTVEDVNPTTLALTGESGNLVKYHSQVAVKTGAQAVKGASLVRQSVTCGSHTLTGDGTLEGVESGTIVVSATDSRGNTTAKTVERKLVGYVRLSCTLGQGTPDASGRYDLEVAGACYYGSFGEADNTLTVEYRYRAQGTEAWGAWTAVDRTTPMGFTYVAHATVEGLDYQTAYEFQARATDALEQVESGVQVVKASPGFDWGKDDFAFHIPVYIQGVKVTPDVGQNLLINPCFTVNQRGSTTYTITKPTYTLDGWKTSGDTTAGEVVVGQNYAKLTNTSGTLGLGQFVEDYGALAGETVTLSMAVDILSGSYHLGLNDGTGQAGEVLSQKGLQVYALTVTLSDSPSQLWCQLISEGAASCRIFGAKLEVGDHQTLAIQGKDGAWQLTQQPDPEEILRCYRYQYVPVEGDTSYPLGYGFAFSTSSARMVFPCGVKMRLAPSVTFLNGSALSGIGIFNNGASHTPTAVAGTRNLPGGVGVIFTTSGLVTNDVCTLRSISGKLLFDANL